MLSILLTNTMDLLHENSATAIETLQTRFHQQSSVFFMISNVFDPRYAFLFYSPLLFSLDWEAGKKIMWVSVISEWSNQVLKWMLHGERPYWWIHETQIYNKTGMSAPDIQQYFLTCETGPGSPSGHAMVTAAVFYVIMETTLKRLGAISKNSMYFLHKVCWITYFILLVTVSISRVYIAAHFPHQCVMGVAIGCLVAMLMGNISFKGMTVKHYFGGTIALLTSALFTFSFLLIIGMNPSWSIDRAIKWCEKQEYIHLDTTPFFSMMRYSGFLLGMGFGLSSNNFKSLSETEFTSFMRILTAVLSVSVAKFSERIDLPRSNMMLFYCLAFVFYAFLSYIIIGWIPYTVHRLCRQKRKSD